MRRTPTVDTLFYGDNLDILRTYVEDDSVDLIYLDPPFNSNATYNVLFSSPTGEQSPAQIEAFGDTWHWNTSAERAFDEVIQSGNSDAANMLIAMRSFLGENDMMAYLTMMAVRLIQLHRVLKSTGSLYLHCDPTASHYLKVVMDAIFGPQSYINEVIWKRYGAHNDVGQGSKHYGRVHDTLFFYSKSGSRHWRQLYTPLSESYSSAAYRHTDEDGQVFRLSPLTGPGGAEKGNPVFEWNGHTRAWRINKARMQELHDEGKLHYSRTGYVSKKLYLEDSKGTPVQSVWTDVASLSGSMAERLGYPTQKPLALLERIIQASSNEGDLVLDPFCGCGTTVHAAQKLNRRWIGIDITHLAIGLITRRLHDAFPMAQLEVLGVPKDLGAAQALSDQDKHQFQLWALSLLENAQPYKGGKKGADKGVDGYVYFKPDGKTTERAIVSVKGGAHVSDTMVKDLITTVDHEGAKMGLFVTLAPPTKPMISRAASTGFYKTEWREYPKIQILTIAELLDGKRPEMPWLDPSVFRKAKREAARDTQGNLDV